MCSDKVIFKICIFLDIPYEVFAISKKKNILITFPVKIKHKQRQFCDVFDLLLVYFSLLNINKTIHFLLCSVPQLEEKCSYVYFLQRHKDIFLFYDM